MESSWKSINELRETTIDISGCSYSLKYAKKHNLIEKKHSEHFGENPSMWIPEPIEVAVNNNSEILYRTKEVGTWYEKQKERFNTSLGTFISHDYGEFGGELITPKGNLRGNFVEVFECDNTTYAIDSCNHMGVGHINIYSFSKDLKAAELYSSEKHNDDNVLQWISFKGLFLSDKFAYILASGDINYDYLNENSNWVKKSYLLKLRDGKIVEQIEFDYGLSNVENIVVEGNKLIVGMDKIVAIIDLYTKEFKSFTPISIEAEKDILKTKGY